MNAPWYEVLIRFAVAVVATGALGATMIALRRASGTTPGTTPIPLLRFLAGVLVVSTFWRWFLLWLGMQPEAPALEALLPWIQPLNAVVLFSVYLSIALISFHHARIRGGIARRVRERVRLWVGSRIA